MDVKDCEERNEERVIELDRRSLIKGIIGVGSALVAGVVFDEATSAARRGYSGPSAPVSNVGSGWYVQINTDPFAGIGYAMDEAPGLASGTIVFANYTGYDILLEIEGGATERFGTPEFKTYQFTPPRTVRFRVTVTFSGAPPFVGPWGEVNLR